MFRHHWIWRFKWCKTIPKNYSCNDLNQREKIVNPVCANVRLMSEINLCMFTKLMMKFPKQSSQNEAGNQKEICRDQAYTSDRPTSSLGLWIFHLITMLQWVPLPWAGLCLCVNVCKPDWLCWMRILQTGWHVVYRLVLSPFTHWFSTHISEDSSSSMAPRDVLWQGMRERAAKWIQGWAKRSFQRRLRREGREGRGYTIRIHMNRKRRV